MATPLRAVEAPPKLGIVAAIEHEIAHGCYLNPTKRAALQLAALVCDKRRLRWMELYRANELVRVLGDRLATAKV